MKKIKLLLAAMAALVTMGVNAQDWTASPVGAGTFVLYNVGSGQYFTKGNGWGTQASIASEGMTVELVLVDNDVLIRTSGNSDFYGLEYLSGGTVYTDQSRNKVSTWTFTQVGTDNGPVYNIISADNHGGGAGTYLTAEGGESTIVGPGADGTSELAQWKLKAITDFEASRAAIIATMDAATLDAPVDVTGLIGDANFDSSALPIYWAMASSNKNLCGGDASNRCAESYRQPFTLSQTLFVPNGKYELTAQAATNGNLEAYIYANDKTSPFVVMTEGEGSMGAVSASFTAGKYFVDPITVIVTDGKLTIGAKTTRNDSWYIWDNFQLKYYGIDLSAYEDALKEKVNDASALSGKIPTAAYDELSTVVSNNNKTYSTEEAYLAAISAVDEALKTATALVTPYSRYQAVKPAVLAIKNSIDLTAADTQVEAATTSAAIDAAVATLRGALATYLADANITNDKIDLTAALIDNAAPYANSDYWIVTNANGETAIPNAFDTDNKNAEFWNQGGYSIKQTIATEIPAGYYTLTGIAITRTDMTGLLSAGKNSISIVTMPSSGGTAGVDYLNYRSHCATFFDAGNGVNELVFNLAEATKDLVIGLTADNTTGDHWTVWRSFGLTYLGTAPLVLFQKQLADAVIAANAHAEELAIPAGIKSTYTNAISTAATQNSTVDECLESIANIEEATAAADAAVKPYAAYLIAAEDAAIAGVAAATISEQNTAVEQATTTDGINACTTVLRTAIAAIASFDITSFTITNASPYANGDGWTATNGNRLSQWASNPVTYDSNNKCAEMWNNTGASMLYTIVNLPAGRYRLTAIAGTRSNSGSVLKVGDKTVELVSVGSVNDRAGANTWFNNGNGVNELYFTLDETAAELTIGLVAGTSGDAWTLWRSFTLTTYTEAVAAGYLKETLQAAIDAAPAVRTSNIGDGVFQMAAAGVKAYSDALYAAQAAYDDADATVASIEQAQKDLAAAIEAYNALELNAPDADKRYFVNISDGGQAWDGNAITFIAGGRSGEGNYNVQYLAPANANLNQALKFTAVEGKSDTYLVSAIRADGNEQYLTTKKLAYNDGNNDQIRTTDDVTKALEIKVLESGADNSFMLYNTVADKVIARNEKTPDNGVYTSGSASFTIAEASKAEIAINTKKAGWGTIILPFDGLEVPAGLKAYSCEEVDETTQTLTLVEVSALQANKPYILQGAWEQTPTGWGLAGALTYTDGLLTGVYAKKAAPNGSYVLQKNDGVVGFYKVETDDINVPANRAYLNYTAPSGNEVKAFFFGGGEDAIKSVFDGVAAGEVYDLNGRKVAKMQKGNTYIVNGKKVIIK